MANILLIIHLTMLTIVCLVKARSDLQWCFQCKSHSTGSLHDDIKYLTNIGEGPNNCGVINPNGTLSCPEISDCSVHEEFPKYQLEQAEESRRKNLTDKGFIKCSILLPKNQQEIVIPFVCSWSTEDSDAEAVIKVHGIKNKKDHCISKHFNNSNTLKVEIYPHDLFDYKGTPSMVNGSCHVTIPGSEEQKFCEFSIYQKLRVNTVKRGETIEINCLHNGHDGSQIQWVAVGSNKKEIDVQNLGKTNPKFFEFIPNAKKENEDLVIMCVQEQERLVLGIDLIMHTKQFHDKTSTCSKGMTRCSKPNSEDVHLTGTTEIDVMTSKDADSPIKNSKKKSLDGSSAEASRGKDGVTVVPRSFTITISLLALSFSIGTILIVVHKIYGKQVGPRAAENKCGQEEIATVEEGGATEMTHLSAPLSPEVMSDQLQALIETETCSSTGMQFYAQGYDGGNLDENEVDLHLQRETQGRHRGLDNEINASPMQKEVSSDPDIYHVYCTVDDLDEEYLKNEDNLKRKLPSHLALPKIPGDERPHSMANVCNISGSVSLPFTTETSLENLYAQPIKSSKSEITDISNDTDYSRLKRPAVETCMAKDTLDSQGPHKKAQILSCAGAESVGESSPQEMHSVAENNNVSLNMLNELFESQDYQLLDHLKLTERGEKD